MSDITCKLKSKESVLRFKNGSPKLKDVLRKKCKERLRQNRENFIDKLRNIPTEVDVLDTLTDFIKADLKLVYHHDIPKESYYKQKYQPRVTDTEEEPIDEELEWLMSKYDNIFEDEECLASMLEDLNQVICPICQKSSLEIKTLSDVGAVVSCKCGLLVRTTKHLLEIKENIMFCLDNHNSMCVANPQFCILNEVGENHIYLMCYSCSGFFIIL